MWLQALESPALTWLMVGVSRLGEGQAYVGLIIVLAFGVRLRPGLSVLLALLIGGIAIDALKNGLALPRPSYADERVAEPGGEPIDGAGRGSATEFWGLPQSGAISSVREIPGVSFGLPSGHVASATAFLLGAAFFFRSRRLLWFACGWIPLMAVSRMYLGRHYLGDVLGGLVVGLLAAGLAVLILRRPSRETEERFAPRSLATLGGLAVVMLALAPFVPLLDAENVGRLAGLALAMGALAAIAPASDESVPGKRLGRIALAVFLYVSAVYVLGLLAGLGGWAATRFGTLFGALVLTTFTLLGTVLLGRRLRLYPPRAS